MGSLYVFFLRRRARRMASNARAIRHIKPNMAAAPMPMPLNKRSLSEPEPLEPPGTMPVRRLPGQVMLRTTAGGADGDTGWGAAVAEEPDEGPCEPEPD